MACFLIMNIVTSASVNAWNGYATYSTFSIENMAGEEENREMQNKEQDENHADDEAKRV